MILDLSEAVREPMIASGVHVPDSIELPVGDGEESSSATHTALSPLARAPPLLFMDSSRVALLSRRWTRGSTTCHILFSASSGESKLFFFLAKIFNFIQDGVSRTVLLKSMKSGRASSPRARVSWQTSLHTLCRQLHRSPRRDQRTRPCPYFSAPPSWQCWRTSCHLGSWSRLLKYLSWADHLWKGRNIFLFFDEEGPLGEIQDVISKLYNWLTESIWNKRVLNLLQFLVRTNWINLLQLPLDQ